jgi:hypothetical protein
MAAEMTIPTPQLLKGTPRTFRKHSQSVIQAILLTLLLIGGTFIRIDGITKTGLWGDEFQSLYLATARGDAILNIPRNVIIDSPPPVGFVAAPSPIHIPTGLDSTTHPPLYFIILRLWVNAFGSADLSIRAMSTLFCMLGVASLFFIIRRLSGAWAGLLGATMMTFAPVQLDFSQQARPYTLVTFLCLVLLALLLRIEQKGSSPARLISFFLATLAAAMTHYFALGTIAACAAYSLIRLTGKPRRYTLVAMSLALFTFFIAWGPIFWSTRAIAQPWMKTDFKTIYHLHPLPFYLLNLPERLTFGNMTTMGWPAVVFLAILVYLVPPFKRSKALVWYFWILGSIAPPLIVDLYTSASSMLVGMDKYIFLAAPGVYGILAATACGRLVTVVLTLGVLIFGVARFQAGPDFVWASAWGLEDHRAQAAFLASHAGQHDLLILPACVSLNGDVNDASYNYFIISHYTGSWKTPLLLLTAPIDKTTRSRLARFHRVWVAGASQQGCQKMLPDCPLIDVHAASFRDSVWAIK